MYPAQAEPVQTLAEESRAQGTIGVRLYVKYLRAGASIVTLLAAIVLNLLAQVRSKSTGGRWTPSVRTCRTGVT